MRREAGGGGRSGIVAGRFRLSISNWRGFAGAAPVTSTTVGMISVTWPAWSVQRPALVMPAGQ
jgi:hypothetical protein